jgi:hypothetical protein
LLLLLSNHIPLQCPPGLHSTHHSLSLLITAEVLGADIPNSLPVYFHPLIVELLVIMKVSENNHIKGDYSTPAIPATWEVKNRSIEVQDQSWGKKK